ncbi:MAG: GH3 auxin-responsive promoter family protein [Phycisphaerales bacterium]
MSTPAPTPRASLSWTALVGMGLAARVARRAARLRDEAHWRDHAMRAQHETLRDLLTKAAGARVGRDHDFARIASIHDPAERLAAYRKALPVRDWYVWREHISQMRDEGRPDILWPGRVELFAQTSGTTAGDKYIPVSKDMLRSNYLASLDIFAHLRNRGVSLARITSGKCLFLGGSTDLAVNQHGIKTGDLSGLVTPLIRWPISQIYSPGPDIALMNDWPAKIEAMAELTLTQDVRFISGMPSWALVLMQRVLELAKERGRKGDRILDVWPNLEVFVHGGVKYAPFEPRVNQVFSGDKDTDLPQRIELYPASEGFIAIQDREHEPAMRLLSDGGNFFEFVPLERIDDDDPEAFTADKVDKGQRYVVVLTTCAGLWRYNLGDVVEFDSIPTAIEGKKGDGPPRLRIVGRHRHFINAFGENIIVEHIEQAVARAAADAGLTVGEFTAAPVYPAGGSRAALQLAVEIENKPGDEKLSRFATAFDAAIKAVNVDYTTKRSDDLGMGPPTITPIPPGSFHRWLESRGKLGGQHKCPRCANHRDIIDSLLHVAGSQ